VCEKGEAVNERPYTLHHGDAIEFMRTLEGGSVDAIITDPPYGTTQLEWDKPVDWSTFWAEAYRACKPNAVQIVFSAQPFTTDLINSNRKRFRYEIIWPKTTVTGFLDANRRPLRAHEVITVFAAITKGSTYNPQKTVGVPYVTVRLDKTAHHYGSHEGATTVSDGSRYPVSVLPALGSEAGSLHPTQKPTELMAWLVRTYTNPGDLILDPFAGSGSTGVAAIKEGRRFIGSELDENYHAIALKRLEAAYQQPRLMEATA
jgi:site-specific DNA-methyltransferase (adenine-specific)